MMQTRASGRAAAAAAGTVTRQSSRAITAPAQVSAVAAAAAVTPSPPWKKSRRGGSVAKASSTGTSARTIFPNNDDANGNNKTVNTRDEMQRLVRSHIPDQPTGSTSTKQIITRTIGDWCLVEGLAHCAEAADGILAPLIHEHGPPQFYLEHIQSRIASGVGADISDGATSDGYQSFRSLCRIVAGQQLAGAAARTIWQRLLGVVGGTESDLVPDNILSLVENGDMETDLRAPAGLSNAKCRSIVEISRHFRDGTLSDSFLLSGSSSDADVRERLLSVKGIGPWSVDMFLLFQCHRPDIMPMGDLAFRNGTAALWDVKGKGKNASLCQKKDAKLIQRLHLPFAPYRSISAYYMYKCSGIKE